MQACRSLVVAAASRHGGTCEIADRLATTLAEVLPEGWTVVRSDLSDLRTLDGADAVVLGSAIYFGHWMHSAARALSYVKDAALFDLWLFSTGPISEIESENAQIISANAMVTSGQAIEHKVFGGRLDTSRLNWIERAAATAVHALPGDHRDWDQVDEWARHIAEQLGVVPARPGGAAAS
ncbi:flavodoxin domain-containing protein [Aeromicrobium ginsengisoli]|uniref:Protoporphyrinogen oxidase n=1 Tax=Aeromicrobium ginsengisoli TaxID=363867 RepID=A0A5M4FAY0_9ACTN|nr:flavodoxin domain-containing protein [Aeromicrobium ginsengisoli]KAA1395546.1 protoporphyrinogen oxidase [Aeromicrobium ginsengisoli]